MTSKIGKLRHCLSLSLCSLIATPAESATNWNWAQTGGGCFTSNRTWPDGLDYFTYNSPIAGQTFITGSSAINLVSLSVKTAGLNFGGGNGTPAITPTYYLPIYSINGSSQPES